MSIYDNDGKRKRIVVNLTPFQEQKLTNVCRLFGITRQRFLADAVDTFYMDMLEVQGGRINLSTAVKDTMHKQLDDYVKLKELKGIVPATDFGEIRRPPEGRL